MAAPNLFVEKAALNILKLVQAQWGRKHRYNPVSCGDFSHLDLKFYSRCQNELTALGFTLLGDIEDESIKSSSPDPRTFLRIMTSSTGEITAAVYHAKPVFPWPILSWFYGIGPLKIFEFETEFTDGTVVSSTIGSSRIAGDSQSTLIRRHYPKRISIAKLFEAHQQSVNETARNSKASIIRKQSIDAVCAGENRQIEAKRRHLKSIGWISKEYLLRRCGNNKKLADDVYAEVQRLVRKQLITGDL